MRACCKQMHLRMEHGEGLSPGQRGEFLRASEAVRFAGQSRAEVYACFVDERGNEQRIALSRQAWENVIAQLRERLSAWQKEVQETAKKELAEYLAAEQEAARRRMQWDAQVYQRKLQHVVEQAQQATERAREIRMRLFDLKTSRMVLAEQASLRRLGYRADGIQAPIAEITQQREEIRQPFFGGLDYAVIGRRL